MGLINQSSNPAEAFVDHNVVKFIEAHGHISIVVSSSDHFIDFFIINFFSQLSGNSSEVINMDGIRFIIIEKVENLVNSVLNNIKIRFTRLYLSPSLAVIQSRNSSKLIYLPWLSNSAIILKIVGFLDSKPRLCIADFNYLNIIEDTWDQFFQLLQCRIN